MNIPGEIIMTAWYLDGDQPIGWKPSIDQPIHKRDFLVPAYDLNTQKDRRSVDVEFKVGCTTQVEGFGDAMNMGANTGEDPMDDGYFHFNKAGANGSEWIKAANKMGRGDS